MKLTLSTSNIMSAGPSVIRRPIFEKSNTELTSSLRSNFLSHQQASHPSNETPNLSSSKQKPSFRSWTTQQNSTLYIPTHIPSPLTEPREAYDITVKLFYLPGIPVETRCRHTKEAIDLVLRELGVQSVDLLIVSFPGMSFDADDEEDSEDSEEEEAKHALNPPDEATENRTNTLNPNPVDGVDDGIDESEQPESLPSMLTTYRTLETLHQQGLISRLGLSEFSRHRLARFLPHTSVRPSVNQINVRDCCVVPKPLILFAKKEHVELLTHNDCTNVLPRGTLRELLGTGKGGAGVLRGGGKDGGKEEEQVDGDADGLRGDVEPQFVVKYTAVVKDRGVVESKGYFAVADLREE